MNFFGFACRKKALSYLHLDSFDSLQSALHHSLPGNLIGRKNEQTEITEFICSHIKTQTSASMYISGAPGTGKTACLTKILTSSKVSLSIKLMQ